MHENISKYWVLSQDYLIKWIAGSHHLATLLQSIIDERNKISSLAQVGGIYVTLPFTQFDILVFLRVYKSMMRTFLWE